MPTWDTKALKATPLSADEILLIDTADFRNQKRATFASLPSALSDWDANNLSDMGILSFGDANTSLQQSSSDLQIDVATGGATVLRINNSPEYDFDAALFTIQNALFARSGEATITASTTQTQGQGPLTKEINEVATVVNVNDTVTLPSAVAFIEVAVINNGVNTLQIFPASGDDLGNGVDASTTVLTGSNVRFIAYDATNWEIF